MALVDDNAFPKIILAEGSAPSSPSAGQFKLYVDSADHLLKYKNSAGVATVLGQGIADQGTFTYLDGTVGSAPATPASGKLRLYAKTGKVLAVKDDAGVETVLGAGGGGGSAVLGAISYSSGANGPWKTTTSSALSDIDATNASLAISVPASGNVVVMIQAEITTAVAHSTLVLGLRTGSTTLARKIVSQAQNQTTPNNPPALASSDYNFMIPMYFYLTGLTPGALTIKAAFAVDGGGGTMQVCAYDGAAGHDNPFVMVVFAA